MAIESQLKQRLVGIAVVVSLAVIFLPMLLDGAGMIDDKKSVETTFEVPPPPPKVVRRTIDLDARAQQLDKRLKDIPVLTHTIVDAANRKQVKADQPSQQKTIKPTKQVEKVGGDSWIAQIGSFKDQDKAFKLQKKIRAYKIAPVFIQKAIIKGSKSYRVRLGPFLYQKQAKAAIEKLRKKYKVKAVVMKHDQ